VVLLSCACISVGVFAISEPRRTDVENPAGEIESIVLQIERKSGFAFYGGFNSDWCDDEFNVSPRGLWTIETFGDENARLARLKSILELSGFVQYDDPGSRMATGATLHTRDGIEALVQPDGEGFIMVALEAARWRCGWEAPPRI
jgi:hypothetical protein